MRRPLVLRFLLSCALGVSVALGTVAVEPPSAEATTVLWLPLDEMVARADLALVARVDGVVVVEDELAPGLHTEYRLVVTQEIAGEADSAQALVVRLPGGEADGRRLVVEGTPTLDVGSEYVFLLEAIPAFTDAPRFVPLGLGLGVWRVDGATSGEATAVRLGAGLGLVGPDGEIVATESATATVELTGLIEAIAAAAGGRR